MKCTLILAALLLASCGRSSGTPDVQISNAWARETVAGQHGTAAYMEIANRGSGDDRLVRVDAVRPVVAMLHSTTNAGGISRMRSVRDLPVPAGDTLVLSPGGTHLMITGLRSPLRPGDTLPVRLHFEKSGSRAVDVRVVSASASGE